MDLINSLIRDTEEYIPSPLPGASTVCEVSRYIGVPSSVVSSPFPVRFITLVERHMSVIISLESEELGLGLRTPCVHQSGLLLCLLPPEFLIVAKYT